VLLTEPVDPDDPGTIQLLGGEPRTAAGSSVPSRSAGTYRGSPPRSWIFPG
jgi:hypothetical protein